MPKSTFNEALKSEQLGLILEPFWGQGTSSWIVYQNKRFGPLRVRLAIDFLVQPFADWDESQPHQHGGSALS